MKQQQFRKKSDEDKSADRFDNLDVNDVDRLSDDDEQEEDEDEDEFKSIKFLIEKSKGSKSISSQNLPQNEIQGFLITNNLSQLEPLVSQLNLNSLKELQKFSSMEINEYLGPENQKLSQSLIDALNQLQL